MPPAEFLTESTRPAARRARYRGAQRYGGWISVLLGLCGALAWLVPVPMLLDAVPGSPTVFAGTLGCLLAGLALVWPPNRLVRARCVRYAVVGVLIVGGLAVQAQHVFGVDLGLDFRALHQAAGSAKFADSLEAGRMSWTAALAFLCVGAALLLIERHPHRRFISPVEMLCIVPGLIAALALLEHLLLYMYDDAYVNVYSRHPPIPSPTALALLALSFGLWAAAARKRTVALSAAEPEEERIVRAAAFVMIPVVIAAGFGGFVAARSLAEGTMRDALAQSLNAHAERMQVLLDEHRAHMALIAARPDIVDAVRAPEGTAAARAAGALLAREVDVLRNTGFAAVRFETADGKVRASAGAAAQPSGYAVSLDPSGQTSLQWSDGFRLIARTAVVYHDEIVGYVTVEQVMTALTGLALGLDAIDRTTEILIAYRDGDVIYNFPSRFSAVSRVVPASTHSLAVTHAVTGRTGLLKTRDYRDAEVIAAFGPIGTTGLGMVVKVDVDEFYAPVTRQFRFWVTLLVVGVLGALYMLRRLIRPLAIRLVGSEMEARRVSNLLQAKAEELEDSEARIRAILDSTGEAVLTLNGDRNIESVNPAVRRIFGYAPAELLGRPLSVLVQTDADPFASEFGTACVGRAVRADGRAIAVEMTLDRINAAGRAHWVVMARDISERREQERRLHEAHARLEKGLGTLAERNREMATLSRMSRMLQTCATAEEMYAATERFCAQLFPREAGTLYLLTGDEMQPFSSWNGGVRLSERDDACSPRGLCAESAGCNVRDNLVCARLSRPEDTADVTLCIPVTAQEDNLGILVVRVTAETDEEVIDARRHLAIAVGEHIGLALANLRLRESLRGQSIHDPLTGLYNRRYLEEAYRQAEANAQRRGESLVIVLLDIDHFKRFNDNFGHEAGDTVLQAVGALLKASVREGDTACRLGGEEFVLLLSGATLADGIARAEELRDAVRRLRLTHEGRALGALTSSFGVAAYPVHGIQLRALMLAADNALYAAKGAGRDCVMAAAPEDECIGAMAD